MIKDTPISENEAKFMDSWTEQDCINELRRIVQMDETKAVSRNYFRNHSKISEATWNRYFGTFSEFKRQAGVVLTRQQHMHERNIAKHASVSQYKELNFRKDYGDKYIRESGDRFKTVLVCSDLHDKEIDMFYLRVLIDTARRVQPNVICFVGDVFDLAEFGKYDVDPREWGVVDRITFVHEEIFAPLREACPDTQFDLIEGNHEARLLRQMADATPALRSVLADLHGFTIAKLLGLDKFEINYISKADLATFNKAEFKKELAKNYKIYWDTILCHHFPHGRNLGMPGVNGHHHRHEIWSSYNPMFGPYEWHQLGSGHRRVASYTEGEKWHNGFALINLNVETKSTNFDYIPITDFAISGGKWYHREVGE